MSLLDTITDLQQAPKKKRMVILTVSVTICMVIIVGVWLMQLSYQLNDTNESVTKDSSFLDPFKDLLHPLWSNIKSFYEKGFK